jgi:hypothetical protein
MAKQERKTTFISEEDAPMQLKPQYAQTLLNLPRFKNVDIVDLYRLAEEKLTYTRKSGQLHGRTIKGVEIADRAFAIAILVGLRSLNDPHFQMPMYVPEGN